MLKRLHGAAHWIWKNTDPLIKWLQLFGLILGAIWVFFKFETTEADSLQIPASVSAQLTWTWRDKPDPGYCWVSLRIDVSNPGVQRFDVAKVRLLTGRKDVDPRANGLQFIDFAKIQQSEEKPRSYLVARYAPKNDRHEYFTWTYSGLPPEGVYFFKAELLDRKGQVLGSASDWTDRLCR